MAEKTALTAQKPETKVESPVSRMQEPELSQFTSSSIDRIMFLQRTYGNQAVNRLLKSHIIQAKLKVGEPGDKYEQEADRVAEQVTGPTLQRKCTGKCPEDEEKKLIQRKTEGASEMTNNYVSDSFISDLGPGKPLDPATRAFFEPRFGHDFSGVRVHTDAKSAEVARAVNARAFTVGRDIVIGKGEYEPKKEEGKKIIAHELTHVIQQNGESFRNPISSASNYYKENQLPQITSIYPQPSRKTVQRQFSNACFSNFESTALGFVCRPPPSPRRIGTIVHTALENQFRENNNDNLTEVPVPRSTKSAYLEYDPYEPTMSRGRVDLLKVVKRGPKVIKVQIAEIKPMTAGSVVQGEMEVVLAYGPCIKAAGKNCPNPIDPDDILFCNRIGATEGQVVELDTNPYLRWSPGSFILPGVIPLRPMEAHSCLPGVVGYRCKEKKKKEEEKKKKEKKKEKGYEKPSKEKWTGKSIEEQVMSGIDVAQVAYERALRAEGHYEYNKPDWMSPESFEEILKLSDGLYSDPFSATWPGGYRANVVVWVHTSTFGRYIQFYHEYPQELEFYLKYAEIHGGGKREADLLRKTFTEYNVDLLNLITDEYGPDDAKLDLQGIYEERLKLTFLQAFGLLSSGAQIGIFNSAIGVNPSITTHRARYLGTSPKPSVREVGGEIPYQRPYDTIEPWMIPRNLPSFRGIQKSLNKHTGSIQMPTLH